MGRSREFCQRSSDRALYEGFFLFILGVSRDDTFVNGLHVIITRRAFVALDVSEESVLRRELLPVLLDVPPALRNRDQNNHGPSSRGRILHLRFTRRIPCSPRRSRDRSRCRTRRFRNVVHVVPTVVDTYDY